MKYILVIFLLISATCSGQFIFAKKTSRCNHLNCLTLYGYNNFCTPSIDNSPITKYSDAVMFGIFTDGHLGSNPTDSFLRTPTYYYKYIKDGAYKLTYMVDSMNQKDSLDFVVNCGDNTDAYKSPGNTAACQKYQWIKYNEYYDYLKYPHYNCIGNHDGDPAVCTRAEYITYNNVPSTNSSRAYYFFDIEKVTFNLRVIVLDCNFTNGSETTFGGTYPLWMPLHERNWLDSCLSTATGKCIIITHAQIGTCAVSYCTYNNASVVRGILETYGNVLCVLQGHEHRAATETINGIPYVSLVAQSLNLKPQTAWAYVRIDNDFSVHIFGKGSQPSYKYP